MRQWIGSKLTDLVSHWELKEVAFAAGLLAVVVAAMAVYLPPAVDWDTAYRPAALAVLSGRSPYSVAGYFNPPWALLPLIPFAVLPTAVGRAMVTVLGLAVYALVARRLGAGRNTMIVLLLSPPVLHSLLNGSIDWLAVVGFILPPQLGLFFVTIKPQIGIGVAIYWAARTWQDGGFGRTARVFGPISVVMAASFVLFGLWPLRFEREVGLWWNASLWPASIPVGLVLLVAAIRERNLKFSMGASPCLSPYVLLHSWVGALLTLSASLLYSAVAVVGLWVLVLIRALGG